MPIYINIIGKFAFNCYWFIILEDIVIGNDSLVLYVLVINHK